MKYEDRLYKIGSTPLEKPTKSTARQERERSRRPDPDLIARIARGQTFVYHCCSAIAQEGWEGCQALINEFQRVLEETYDTPMVELVNVYRKNNTKDDGICMIAIFKIGVSATFDELRRARPWSWWQKLLLKS